MCTHKHTHTVQCPNLAVTDHVIASTTDTNPGTVVFFSCDENYIRTGLTTIACLENGEWSGSVPTCTTSKPVTVVQSHTTSDGEH